jgi:hypothetical protein
MDAHGPRWDRRLQKGTLSSERLAAAGFYFSPNAKHSDRVVCFECGQPVFERRPVTASHVLVPLEYPCSAAGVL